MTRTACGRTCSPTTSAWYQSAATPTTGKQRGIHHGAAFTRWLTNLVLVIGAHGKLAAPFLHLHAASEEKRLIALLQSEYATTASERVLSTGPLASLGTSYVGCYSDDRSNRVLPHFLASVSPVTPLRCMTALRAPRLPDGGSGVGLGVLVRTAGSRSGPSGGVREEIQSQQSGRDGMRQSLRQQLGGEDETGQAEGGRQAAQQTSQPGCGGDFMLSVYRTMGGAGTASGSPSLTEQQSAAQSSVGASLDFSRLILRPKAVHKLESAFSDVSLVLAEAGRSCDDACSSHEPASACDDALLALIHRPTAPAILVQPSPRLTRP